MHQIVRSFLVALTLGVVPACSSTSAVPIGPGCLASPGVVTVSSNPSLSDTCSARATLASHGVVVMNGGSIAQFNSLFGTVIDPTPTRQGTVSSTDPTGQFASKPIVPDSAKAPTQLGAVAAATDNAGFVRTFRSYTPANSTIGRNAATLALNKWIAAAQQSQPIKPQSIRHTSDASAGAWTTLQQHTVTFGDDNGTSTDTTTVYRLNDTNASFDWYRVDEVTQTAPNYNGCNLISCGAYTSQRQFLMTPVAGALSLFDYGPTGTIGSSSAGFSIGASLNASGSTTGGGVGGGVSATVTQSWTQPDVVTSDLSSRAGGRAGWIEQFSGPGFDLSFSLVHPPAITASGSFYSYRSAIYQVPEGTTNAQISQAAFTVFTNVSRPASNFPTDSDDETDQIQTLTFTPPVFSVSPTAVTITRGGPGAVVNVVSAIPGAPGTLPCAQKGQGLPWQIVSGLGSSLSASATTGTACGTVTLYASSTQGTGTTAVTFSTSPLGGAPSVEQGPVTVLVTVQ